MTSITFVSHDLSRTGAPVVLRSFLAWISAHESVTTEVVALRGGVLREDISSVADSVRLVESRSAVAANRLLDAASAVTGRPIGRRRLLRSTLRGTRRADIVVANTFASIGAAAVIADRDGAALVCHVHELDDVADRVLPAEPERSRHLAAVDRFVATGRAVERMLIERMGIDASRVVCVPAFIDGAQPGGGHISAEQTAALRAELGASPDVPVVVSVGFLGRRKGPECFVDLMSEVADHPSRPVGVWVGATNDAAVHAEMADDIERSGLGDRCRVIGAVADTAPYFAAADVVVSTAHEDPFPLAVLEAGAAGVPVLAMAVGDAVALLSAAGLADAVVAPGDVVAMGSELTRYLEDQSLRAKHGEQLQAEVRTRHLTDVVAPLLYEAIQP